jgi:hypothetical protein
MSIGLLAVLFQYGLYFCVQLSKWFAFLVYVIRLFVALSFFTLAPNSLL